LQPVMLAMADPHPRLALAVAFPALREVGHG
jgi:hypothetical protein